MAETAGAASKFRTWAELLKIMSDIAIIVGVIVSVTQIIAFVDNAKRATQAAKISALKEIKTYIAEDEQVRRHAQEFMKDHLPNIMANLDQKISNAGSGEAFYLSKEMEEFAEVHYHYEQMGALVKLGYVDFPLIFEVIAFPDNYMDAVRKLRNAVAANWKGPGKDLPDLGSNIDFLKRCYEQSRKDEPRRVSRRPRYVRTATAPPAAWRSWYASSNSAGGT